MESELKKKFEEMIQGKVISSWPYSIVEYDDVMNAMQSTYNLSLQDKWISVDDSLPENDHWYRILTAGEHHILPHCYMDSEWWCYGSSVPGETNVSHWQPFEDLPQPPQSK